MKSLKNNIQNISDETRSVIKHYINLFSIKQTEKLSVILGLLTTIFFLSILLLIIVVFFSIALSLYINSVFESDYIGFLIVASFYILIVLFLILKMKISHKPLFSNIILRFVISVFDLNITHNNSFSGLQQEVESIKNEIDKSKIKINADIQLIKYLLLESIIKDFLGFFKSKKQDEDIENQSEEHSEEKMDKEKDRNTNKD